MSERLITPRNRGFLFLDSHPAGCRRLVRDAWASVPPLQDTRGSEDGPVALILGSSAGYGMAATIAGLARTGIRGIGVCLEKEPGRRTATAGWYRTAALAELAREHGRDMVFVNGDAFGDDTKDEVAAILRERFDGRLDHLVYAVAAPRRADPATGLVHTSVLKPLGTPHHTKTLVFDAEGNPDVQAVSIPAAQGDDVQQTVAVMGGHDWQRWIDHLSDRRLLADGFTTTALSYIGAPITERVYRQGTIGAAKAHLEATARSLDVRLREQLGGRALISVNGAAVTQSSTAVPSIALYTAILRAVIGERMISPIGQFVELWDLLTSRRTLPLDAEGRVRLDTWELDDAVQAELNRRWDAATTQNIAGLADLDWFTAQVRRLYGFAAPGTDYGQPVRTDVPWPEAERTAAPRSVLLPRTGGPAVLSG
ncbi:enoyl-[acyl-carrier-protein] reductase FabV [Streptomyces sp. NBC_01264]|uniref:enoyl-[acyl-carrier-protein] reductase FabV n=1 Tax=Streptomyces sp. NBC_01264 TaxID=2903804 RepID=UPI00225BA70C|nr:enoyl-[acyl-carrier-protein] reductase FabV [Streptomyces sp. NBC_01264]MCX4781831.1 enoyl-[acyl-carrier-protein] reductase FabV [Streptomyces sp. NBC_01264]